MPFLYFKYVLAAGATLMWTLGLVGQLPDVVQTAKYVGISLLMLAIAVI